MNLELFNNLINKTKENGIIQSFMKELKDFLENNLDNNKQNQESLLQKILDGRTLTTRYRDEINIQRHKIITDYSKENSEQGEFYYVYNKDSNNIYGLVMHKDGNVGESIELQEEQLPEYAGVDSVLRINNGNFVLDKNATEKIQEKLTKMIEKLLEEQSNRLEEQRVEGNVYEFVEKSDDTVTLFNVTNYTGECFQEVYFPKKLFDKAIQGTRFQYVNGEYILNEN